MTSPEKAADSRVRSVDCSIEDHIAVTNTGRFVGNADHFSHTRYKFEKRRSSCQQIGTPNAYLTY